MTAQRPNLFQRLVGAFTGLFAPEPTLSTSDDTDAKLARLLDDYNRKVDALVRGVENGTVTVGQFVGSMPSLIKQHHLAAAVVAGGGAESATPQTYALAQRQVDDQLRYFEAWKATLLQQAVNGDLPTPAYLANRAKLYGKAVHATAQQAQTGARGVPPLPFYPAQGTRCKANCRCAWDIKVLDVVNGNYDCYYTRSADESCPTCIARERAANPLKVRRGVIVDAEKYQEARLYA